MNPALAARSHRWREWGSCIYRHLEVPDSKGFENRRGLGARGEGLARIVPVMHDAVTDE
jgi:hypothetical protein